MYILFSAIILLLIGFPSSTSRSSVLLSTVSHEELIIQIEYLQIYEEMIDTLQWHEGYRAYPYRCMANVPTVGYGHAIKEGEVFKYPMTREKAEQILRNDFEWAVEYVRNTTDLEHNQLLAIAHFVHALGAGNFNRSTLKKLIVEGKSIDKEIVKWVHIRTKSGKIIKNKHLLRSRIMELELYNNPKT